MCVYNIEITLSLLSHLRYNITSSYPLGAQLEVPSGGQGGCYSLKPRLTISLPNQLIYSPSSSTLQRLNLQQTNPPNYHRHSSLCPLSIYLHLPPSLWLGVKTPAARSSGDKSDLPSRVTVKHPPGRLRPPHPFNSSTGMASQGKRRVLHAAA